MAEDWRVSVTLEDDGGALPLARALQERDVRNELRDEFGRRIAVSHDGPTIFLYASTRHAAEAAEQQLRETLAEHDLAGLPVLDRWHPIEERWESASVPLPADEEQREREVARREQDERASGVAAWEVRVELESHGDAVELASQLEQEGLRVVRRWRYLLIGTATQEEAEKLARRLGADSPHGARVEVEPGLGLVWQLLPLNPFAVFGGLGG